LTSDKSRPPSTPFTRIGRSVYRRRKLVVVVWVLALLLVVPVILREGSVTSLQQGTATGSQLESVQASDIISAQFQNSVPNSTLLVVVTAANVSSPATQQVVAELMASVREDPGIKGLTQTLDVYSRLYASLRGVNNGTFTALDNAASTSSLYLGVPAAYINFWEAAYQATNDVTASDNIAFLNASRALNLHCSAGAPACPPAALYLGVFNSTWADSWANPATAGFNLTTRILHTVHDAATQFALNLPAASRQFALSVVGFFSVGDFLYPNTGPSQAELRDFAESYVVNSTAYSPRFVDAAYSLGRTYGNASLYRVAGDIVWRPAEYGLDPSLSSLVTSLVSPDRQTALVNLGLNQSLDQNILAVRSVAQQASAVAPPESGVMSIQVTGGDAISYDFGNSTQADLGLILPVTIVLLIAATGIFFRSFLTPFITLGTIGVGLGISQVFIVIVGTYIAKVDFTIPTILLTVLIGVGTDYSVFVIARYREQRVRGDSVQAAVETSVTWAGESIATSGATVIISFLALSLTSITFLQTMGIVVGLGVLVALSVALTLVPATVGLVGERTFWPTSGARFTRYSSSVLSKLQMKRGYFSRSGAFAVKRAKPLIILALVATVPATYVYLNTTPTYDFLSAAPGSLESVAASNQLTSSFGGGALFPTYVVMTFDRPLVSSGGFNLSEMATVAAAESSIATAGDVRNVTGPANPFGAHVAVGSLNASMPSDARTYSAILKTIGKDNRTALITINFAIDPYSTQAISDAQSIRSSLHANFDHASGVDGIYVGGASGSILDTKTVFDSQFSSVVPIVAVGVGLVLFLVLGSLFLPLFAVLSVLMSIVWTLAATKLVFQQFFSYQILFITPFFLFVTLLGLGMDYNIFILTRIREEATKGRHLDDAIVGAIEQTGGIITAAAVILAGSLGALMLSSDLLLKQIGFAFAYSILIDALIVRTYLVPAVMSTVGRWNWYSPVPRLNRSRALFRKDEAEGAHP
jgi:putative drug exporter of the RND superfamily